MNNHLKIFNAEVAARLPAKKSSYAAHYIRLVFTRRMIEFIMSTILIFGGQQFIVQNAYFSPLWPAAGVGLSAIFLRGNFILVGVFLGTFLSYYFNHIALYTSLIHTSLFTGYIYFSRLIILRTIGPVTPIATLAVFWKFCFLMGIFTLLHILTLPLTHHYDKLLAWLGELNGVLFLVPLSLIFDPFAPKYYFHRNARTARILSLLLICGHFLFFIVPIGIDSYILSFTFLCLMSIFAKYFGQIPTCMTLLGISTIYLGGVFVPFHLFHLSATRVDAVILFLFLFFTGFISISIATLSSQQKSLELP